MDESRTIESHNGRLVTPTAPGKLAELRQLVVDRFRRRPETPTTSSLHPAVIEAPEKEMLYGDVAKEISPKQNAGYEFSPRDWTEWLRRNIDVVQKAPQKVRANAGALMYGFVYGVNYMYEEHLRRGNEFPEKPHIGIALFQDTAGAGDGRVWVSRNYLLGFARKPLDIPESIQSTYADTQTVSFYGTPMQRLRLTGVHEADHAQYQQTHPDEDVTFEQTVPDQTSQARYDAKPIELRALQEEMLYAEKSGFPQETISVLRRRIAAAKQFQLNLARHFVREATSTG